MTILSSGVLLVGGWLVGCGPETAPDAPALETAVIADTTLQGRLFEQGLTYQEFMANADRRVETWTGNYARAVVPPNLTKRAKIMGEWRLLVVAEDWCGDSANTIPYLARLVEDMPAVEMRVVDSDAGSSLMEAHRTPDGRGATPTVLLLDTQGEIAGCWIERPTELQRWYLENESTVEREELLRQKYAWYDEDLGRTTMAEVVEMIETAAAGDRWCAATP